jgi:hypothetical protein
MRVFSALRRAAERELLRGRDRFDLRALVRGLGFEPVTSLSDSRPCRSRSATASASSRCLLRLNRLRSIERPL